MQILDLTHTFDGNMPVYPGDPHVQLTQIARVQKDGFTNHELKTGLHVGTHMDAPLHMLEGGKNLADISVEKYIGRGHLVDARGQESVGAELLDALPIEPGDILLICTGHSAHFRKPEYYASFPVVSEDFATRAVELQVSMIGMDTPSPDVPPFAVHKILLGSDVLIVENLTNLEKLFLCKEYRIIALPVKLKADAAPVRVIALVE